MRVRFPGYRRPASIASSVLTINKTSIEMFVSESFDAGTNPPAVLDHSDTSMFKDKSLGI